MNPNSKGRSRKVNPRGLIPFPSCLSRLMTATNVAIGPHYFRDAAISFVRRALLRAEFQSHRIIVEAARTIVITRGPEPTDE
jgi:hypothetical protein